MSDIVGRRDAVLDEWMELPRTIRDCEWDTWNRDHIVKHGITEEEAGAIVFGTPLIRDTYKNRLQFIGPTSSGHMLSVIVGPVPDNEGVVYVFSARPASRKKRKRYDEWNSAGQG